MRNDDDGVPPCPARPNNSLRPAASTTAAAITTQQSAPTSANGDNKQRKTRHSSRRQHSYPISIPHPASSVSLSAQPRGGTIRSTERGQSAAAVAEQRRPHQSLCEQHRNKRNIDVSITVPDSEWQRQGVDQHAPTSTCTSNVITFASSTTQQCSFNQQPLPNTLLSSLRSHPFPTTCNSSEAVDKSQRNKTPHPARRDNISNNNHNIRRQAAQQAHPPKPYIADRTATEERKS